MPPSFPGAAICTSPSAQVRGKGQKGEQTETLIAGHKLRAQSMQSRNGTIQRAGMGTVRCCHLPGRDAHLAASPTLYVQKIRKNRKDEPSSHRRKKKK